MVTRKMVMVVVEAHQFALLGRQVVDRQNEQEEEDGEEEESLRGACLSKLISVMPAQNETAIALRWV